MDTVFGRSILDLWPLDPSVTYLNHGTVGVVPRRVLAAQQALRDRIERQPSHFMLRELAGLTGPAAAGPTLMRAAAAAVAEFVGARPDDLVFVDNTTAGVNAVLRSFPLERGDEIIVTDHAYGAIANAAHYAARTAGACVQVVEVPYPPFDAAALIASLDAAISDRTRLVLVDHVAAEGALLFPVAEIARRCRRRGVAVLVDGAHVPGAVVLDVEAIGADYYVANLHKWAHAPRSSAFLVVQPSRQASVHPLVISWGLDTGFTREFDWVGTRDPTPWLIAPEGIRFLRDLGLDRVRAYNHDLAWRAAVYLADRWGSTLAMDESAVGCMATVAAPASAGTTGEDAMRLRDRLWVEDRIEVHVHARAGRVWLRVSAQAYNEWADIERLGEAVRR
jgi:isopenicillin-N epimerase